MTQQQEETTKSKAMTKPLEGIPLPDIENLPDYERGFWEAARSHELRIQQCSDCKKLRHLPTPMCPYCHSLEYDWTKMSGRGKVYSHLIVRHPVHRALREKEQTPLQHLPYRVGGAGWTPYGQQYPEHCPRRHVY